MLDLRSTSLWPPTRHDEWIDPEGEPGLVSVIIPAYNRANLLIDALDSVFEQTYRPIECIVVDDGSEDDTQKRVREWKNRLGDPERFALHYLRQENRGASSARNSGVLASRGEYIQLLDCDDVLLPEKIDRCVEFLSKSGADYMYCIAQFVNSDLREIKGSFGRPDAGTDADLVGYIWQFACPLFKRSTIYNAGPWFEGRFYGDDWEYAARLRLLGAKSLFDEHKGVLFRCFPNKRLESKEKKLKEASDNEYHYDYMVSLARHVGRFSPTLAKRMARRFFITALNYGTVGSMLEKDRCLWKARELNPVLSFLSIAICLIFIVRSRFLLKKFQWALYAYIGI